MNFGQKLSWPKSAPNDAWTPVQPSHISPESIDPIWTKFQVYSRIFQFCPFFYTSPTSQEWQQNKTRQVAGWSSLRSDLSFGRIRLIFSGVVGLMVSYLPCKLQDDRPTFFSCQILQFLSEFFGHFIPVRWDNGRQVKKGACSAVFQPNWIQLSTWVA